MRFRLASAVLAMSSLAVPAALAQPSFSQYVALGDSYMAGVVSNALVETHQQVSIPALLARQGRATGFQQPLVTEPGIPAELALLSLAPSAVIAPKSPVPGVLRNGGLATAYSNLSIPNTTAADLVSRTTDSGGTHDLVLRGKGSALTQAVGLKPTFATIWVGNDEMLGAVLRGRAIEGQTLTPTATFRAGFQELVRALRQAGATVVAGNVIDVTALPFATTVKPYVVDPTTGEPVRVNGAPVPLLGPNGPLPDGTLVTLVATSLIAQGVGVPTSVGGKGTPLPDEVILDAGEQAQIRARVLELNGAIAEVCQAAGVRVVDLAGFYQGLLRRGRTIGGILITNTFLTGGFWSYDGVHPTELGYALLANEWIAALNDGGATLPLVSLGPYLEASSSLGAASVTAPSWRWTTEAQQALRDLYARRP